MVRCGFQATGTDRMKKLLSLVRAVFAVAISSVPGRTRGAVDLRVAKGTDTANLRIALAVLQATPAMQ